METGSDRAAREEQVLAELAEGYPDVTVERVPGIGFEAYPRGMVILRTVSAEAMRAKLRRQREESGQ